MPKGDWLDFLNRGQSGLELKKGKVTMAIHRKILEWQAANPTMTWIFWGIVWLIVLYVLFRPSSAGGV